MFGFIVVTMFSIGLTVTAQEILGTLQRRSLIIRTLIANLILVPILGLILIYVFTLPPDVEVAVAMLALAPGGMQAIQFTRAVKEERALAVGILFLLSVAALVLSPVLAAGVAIIQTSYKLPYGRLFILIIVLLLVPLLMGFVLEERVPAAARRAQKPVVILANVLFLAGSIYPMTLKRGAVREVGLKSAGVMLILILGSMLIGWLLGGPNKGSRQVLMVNTSMRNAGLCLLVGLEAFPETAVYLAVLAYMLLMVSPNGLVAIFLIIKKRREKYRSSKSDRESDNDE
jgi:BASS family bile acid:Na+ symporter